ncbi:dehydrogenase/reductase SDR family member 4 isoform X1 [Balaenoptera musculus]|uniref:Dehydrogenase/reductase SDR family member 4 isoform X1 n=1 Tax=Balaenoptera musculus TaxID=9771 RepID=A0A8B8WWV9_BALMU|nr:dehydrogenase/reductase SDR family member 4 isoform X1 [Balaenoptera musculus]
MQKAGLLLGLCARTWKSVRMASSAAARRNPLENKVALVTASTDGIGFAIARRLAQDGAHVVVSSRKQQNVDRAVATLHKEGLSVTGTVCHVGKGEDRERLVATAVNLHGGVDILVSNAAVIPFFGNLMDVTEEVWDKILDINVKATALMTKAVVPEMEKRGGGSVVIVASVGAYRPFPGLGPYNVCKTALLGLTKNLALELAQRNIRVNCLAPGLIKTNFSRMPRVQTRPPHDPFLRCTVRLRNSDTTQAISYLLKKRFPFFLQLWDDQARLESLKATMQIKRIGKPEDCAGIVSFLCSEDASYITGETVVVAGGMPSRL